MKTFYRCSAVYTVLGLAAGVFYREFTKLQGYQGITSLSALHTHLLILGTFFFLILLLSQKQVQFNLAKSYKLFLYFYNIGLSFTVFMLTVRGILQVQEVVLSTGINAMISGLSGMGHISLGIGFFFFFKVLKQRMEMIEKK